MKNVVISVILLVFIFGLVVFVSASVERDCDEIMALIDGEHFSRAVEVWCKREPFIAIFVHDTKIDAVNIEARMLEKNENDAVAAIRMREAVEELLNSELPNAENIL